MTPLTREIIRLRKEKGLRQEDVAIKLKLKRATYAKKESEGSFVVDEIPALHKIIGGSKEKLQDLASKQSDINIDNWQEYLVKSVISNNAMIRVLLSAISEMLAQQRNESVTKVLSELTTAVEGERLRNSMKP